MALAGNDAPSACVLFSLYPPTSPMYICFLLTRGLRLHRLQVHSAAGLMMVGTSWPPTLIGTTGPQTQVCVQPVLWGVGQQPVQGRTPCRRSTHQTDVFGPVPELAGACMHWQQHARLCCVRPAWSHRARQPATTKNVLWTSQDTFFLKQRRHQVRTQWSQQSVHTAVLGLREVGVVWAWGAAEWMKSKHAC